ncbi:MAG: HAMP domain-containing histidine kinase, partial [Chloroflexi bacterium]|nr:HAMP domain-containing histidine kinase [Chloroflexota bacterium]
ARGSVQQLLYLNSLTRDVLADERERHHPLAQSPVAVAHVAAHTVASLQPLASARGICLRFQETRGVPSITGDEYQLQRAFTNLIHNALQHSVEGSTVQVAVMRNGRDGVVFTVDDEGCGFSENALARLVEIDDRGDSEHASDQGLGIGLIIARRIALAHGGALTIHNRADRGASLRLMLPREGQENRWPSCA